MSAVFPLTQCYLPGDTVVLRVFEPRYLAMFDDQRERGLDTFVSVLIERGPEVGGGDRRFPFGVEVRVRSVDVTGSGLVVVGLAVGVVRVADWLADDPWPQGVVETVSPEEPPRNQLRDAASALTVLAQSVRSLLERHGVDVSSAPAGRMSSLLTVAGGRWCGAEPDIRDVDIAFWSVARAVPCGPLDRYSLLVPADVPRRVSTLRRVVEHTDEVLAFARDPRR